MNKLTPAPRASPAFASSKNAKAADVKKATPEGFGPENAGEVVAAQA